MRNVVAGCVVAVYVRPRVLNRTATVSNLCFCKLVNSARKLIARNLQLPSIRNVPLQVLTQDLHRILRRNCHARRLAYGVILDFHLADYAWLSSHPMNLLVYLVVMVVRRTRPR